VPCVAIGAVRVQMEKTQPPRGLFVPFQLGRPLGEPEDPAFQRRVLLQALGLLERTDGPVILEDFPDDPPGWRDTPGWVPPRVPALGQPDSPDAWRAAFAAELAELHPVWERAQARYGRSTVGLSLLPPADWPGVAAELVAGGAPQVTGHATPALALRFLSDDVKALYGEAGQADGRAPSSRQLGAGSGGKRWPDGCWSRCARSRWRAIITRSRRSAGGSWCLRPGCRGSAGGVGQRAVRGHPHLAPRPPGQARGQALCRSRGRGSPWVKLALRPTLRTAGGARSRRSYPAARLPPSRGFPARTR
jgi:hypothetical protein